MNPDRIPEWIRNGPSIIGRFGGAALLSALACQADAPAQKTAGDNPGDRISGQLNVEGLPSELAFMRNVVVEETPTPIPTLTPTPEAVVTPTPESVATPQPDRASLAGGGGPVPEEIVDSPQTATETQPVSKPEVLIIRPCLPGDLTPDKMPKNEFYVSRDAQVELKYRPEPGSEVVAVVGEGTKLNNVCGLRTTTNEAGKSLYPRLVEVENDGLQGWIIVGQDRVQDTRPNLAPARPAPVRVPTPEPAQEEQQAAPPPPPETTGASCTIPDSPHRKEFPTGVTERRRDFRLVGPGGLPGGPARETVGKIGGWEILPNGRLGVTVVVRGQSYKFYPFERATYFVFTSDPVTRSQIPALRNYERGVQIRELKECDLEVGDFFRAGQVPDYYNDNYNNGYQRVSSFEVNR